MPLEPGQWVFPKKPGVLWNAASQATIIVTATFGRFWLCCANRFRGHNTDVLQKAIDQLRRERKPLLTVANHTSCFDDMVLCAGLRLRNFWNIKHVKWTPGASEIAFTTKHLTYYFSLGQITPVLRGDGVYQQGMDICIEKLNGGGWSHIYPEGKVNMTQEFLRLKWGVGRVISECHTVPTVIPMWHIGMDNILPNFPPYFPRWKKKVTLLVGQPLDFRDVVAQMKAELKSPIEIRKKLTDTIQEEMKLLKAKAEALHAKR